jgi:hypothetical protein
MPSPTPASRIPTLKTASLPSAPLIDPPQAATTLVVPPLESADLTPLVLRNMSARAQRRQTLKQQRLSRLQQKEQQAEVRSGRGSHLQSPLGSHPSVLG